MDAVAYPVSLDRHGSRSLITDTYWRRAWILQELFLSSRVHLADARDRIYGVLALGAPSSGISYESLLREVWFELPRYRRQGTIRRRDWVTAPGRTFGGSWDGLVDSVDITQTPRLQIQDSQTAQASTCVQQGAAGAVHRQTQRIEQLDVEETEVPPQDMASWQLWARMKRAARARVKSFNEASMEEVKKKPIATFGVVAAVGTLVYTVASRAK